jgi:hypothetical protein
VAMKLCGAETAVELGMSWQQLLILGPSSRNEFWAGRKSDRKPGRDISTIGKQSRQPPAVWISPNTTNSRMLPVSTKSKTMGI